MEQNRKLPQSAKEVGLEEHWTHKNVPQFDDKQTAMGVSEIKQLFEQSFLKIEKDAENTFDKGIPTLLHKAIEDNDINTIKKLLQRRTNINCVNADGVPAVNLAIKQRKWEIVKLLAKYGVDLNNPDNEGSTALTEAIYQCDFAIIYYLLQRGASFVHVSELKLKKGVDQLIYTNETTGNTEFHMAVIARFPVWVFDYFNAERVNQLNNAGDSPLALGIQLTIKMSTFHKLLALGADLKGKDKNGNSLFHLAIIRHHIKVINFFTEPHNLQTDFLFPNKHHETPISLSVKHGLPSAVIKTIHWTKEGDCSICFSTNEDLYYLENCKHSFCRGCIKGYLSSFHYYNESFSCPHIGCKHVISLKELSDLMSKSQFEKYNRVLLENCLKKADDFQWCPECEDGGFYNEFQYDSAGSYINAGICSIMQCNSCPAKFCNICSLKIGEGEEDVHKETCNGYASLQYIKSLSKVCPNCKVFVQHAGGCSHMNCTFCNYQFCYVCLGPYKGRQVYDLNSACTC